jgi:Fe(3+) dicitrate transport protein
MNAARSWQMLVPLSLLFAGAAAADPPVAADGTSAASPPSDREASEPPPSGDGTVDLASLSEEELMALFGGEVVEIREKVVVTPGSVHTVDKEELERHERNDIHHILIGVPGVYVREEDGFGLRPNIGMRGVSSERSAKVALMEDGVLLAPAPYSAPAAYYFPLVARMRSVEVTKGPAAILHGPNTVGGAVNLASHPIGPGREGEVDAALGGDAFRKLHLRFGDRGHLGGVSVEGVTLGSSGFKQLDGGGDTGFVRNELVARGRLNSDPDRTHYHQIDLKVSLSNEGSNETYTGLTDGDFLVTPYRRYAGTQLDRLDWTRWAVQGDHTFQLGGGLALSTTAYHQQFDRAWRKLNGFAGGNPLEEVLAAPERGANQVYYQLLTGAADSTGPSEALVLGTNDRSFVSQGLQSQARLERPRFGFDHELKIGARLHHDSAERDHSEERYLMAGGQLVAEGGESRITRDATGSATALALWVQDQARRGRLTLTGGVRGELIASRSADRLDPAMSASERYGVLIPGGGAFFAFTDWVGVLAGVHRGFVPVAPGQGDRASPETSINYEVGARVARPRIRGEVVGFFSDYSNLKGTCSFSSGCPDERVEDEFDGGRVHILGAEASARGEIALGGALWLPLAASYTYSMSSFRTAFVSANPEWGTVEVGDELAYLPRHQLAAELAVRGTHWETAIGMRHTSSMRDVAGTGEMEEASSTDAVTTFDLAAHLFFGSWGAAYVTVDNLSDQAQAVARRPYGVRPGKPRTAILGYRKAF